MKPLIIFDEISLAESSKNNPLKVLHKYLEVGNSTVAFIGISNWALDASKMSRFMILRRNKADFIELVETAKGILSSRVK